MRESVITALCATFVIFLIPIHLYSSEKKLVNLEESKDFIKKFRKNPKSVIDSPIQKYDENGKKIKITVNKKTGDRIYVHGENQNEIPNFKLSEKYVEKIKIDRLDKIPEFTKSDLEHIKGGKRPSKSHPSLFLGSEYTKNLAELPKVGSLSKRPWSNDYWPLKYGITSKRYNWRPFYEAINASNTWETAVNCYKQPEDYMSKKDANDFDEFVANYYSPSEKYDLLVGDNDFTLTNTMKENGRQYLKDGNVEGWMGICHGWAPASYAVPRAVKKITLIAQDGKTNVTFYPDDIKALISQKWAKTRFNQLSLGGRCNLKNSEITKDSTTGAIIDDRCFDVNPANWHLAVTNFVGIRNQSFVIDATFDYEVWNQPLYSYSVSYFNPKSGEFSEDINESRAEIGDWDVFSKVDNYQLKRSSNAKYIIGVVMQISYIAETTPSHSNDPNSDKVVIVKYIYDLGLNEDNEIVDEGEWWQNAHPDFMWTTVDNAIPSSYSDRYLDKLNFVYTPSEYAIDDNLNNLTNIIVPSTDLNIVKYSSTVSGGSSPLRIIIEGLLSLSKE